MTAVRASWLLAHDGTDHVIVENGIVEWDGDRVSRIRQGDGPLPDGVLDLPGRLVMPGLVCLHSHAGSQAIGRLVLDKGRKDVFGGGFQNTIPRRGAGRGAPEDTKAGALATLLELAKGGATTILEAGSPAPMADALLEARSQVPVRLYLGPSFRSADWATEADGRIAYDWRPDGGLGALAEAERWIAKLPNGGAGDGLVGGVIYPSILDYCTAELLQAAKATADRRGAIIQIHAGQSLFEFHEVLHRTTMTPIEWLDHLGVLGPRTQLAHCFATTANPRTAYPGGRDLDILAASGATVVNCPVAIGRRGNALHWIDAHQRAGVRVAIGTDTFPHDMFNEMRTAQLAAKLMAGDPSAGSARAVLRAATTDGAAALGRPDLGRLAPGSAADLIAVNLRSLTIGPVRDPIEAALSAATTHDIELVVVAGKTVVRDGTVPGVDEQAIVAQLQQDGERSWAAIGDQHWTGRPADDVFPRAVRVARPDEFR